MQDSSNREWDERFVDQAWGNMRRLLDEELPAAGASSRRRGAMVLFFLLGLVLGGAGIRYFFDRPVIGYFPIPDRAIAQERARSATELPGAIASTPPAVTTALSKETTGTVNGQSNVANEDLSSSASALIAGESGAGMSGGTPEYVETHPSSLAPIAVTEREPEAPIVQNQPAGQHFEAEDAALAAGSPPTLSGLLAGLVPLDDLPVVEIPLLSGSIAEEMPLLPPLIAGVADNRFQWRAEAGGNYDQSAGYFGGLQVNYRLGRRWGLQSGLQYGQLVSNLDNARPLADFSASVSEAQSDPSTGLNTNVDQSTERAAAADYYDVDIRLRQLSAPLLVTYRISRKWQLAMGAHAHYLLAANRPVREAAGQNTSFNAAGLSKYDRQLTGIAAPDNTIDPQLLRDWNLGAVLGAAFQPAERWSFHLRFQYGVFNWLEADRFYIAPTNLQLSAAYRLGR